MPLKDLLIQIKSNADKKIEDAKKEGNAGIEELDNSFREKMGSLRESLEVELGREKERILNDYTRDRSFESKRRILSLKESILRKLAEKAFEAISAENRKSFYRKEIEKSLSFLGDGFKVYVPLSEKSIVLSAIESLGIGGQAEIIDKNEIRDGFLLETDKILLSISVRDAIRELIEKEKGRLSSLLLG